jgi:hypothetical protein
MTKPDIEIIVEIGTEEQKTIIRNELSNIITFVLALPISINLLKIIISTDLSKTIRMQESNELYNVVRGACTSKVTVIAKTINLDEGNIIVISPDIYTESYDTIVRYFIVFHEISHLINKQKFTQADEDSYVLNQYRSNLYTLYDEYSADRLAYTLIDKFFPNKSELWNSFLENEITGFYTVLTDLEYYDGIKEEINSYRSHADLALAVKNIHKFYDDVAISLSHMFPLVVAFPNKTSYLDLSTSPFVNNNTYALMEYFNHVYLSGIHDLSDGIELIADFMANFGVRFEHRDNGGYCHILDI